MERFKIETMVNAMHVTLQPGDATRYRFVFATKLHPDPPQEVSEVYVGVFMSELSSTAVVMPADWLDAAYHAIEGMDLRERVTEHHVQWLAGEYDLNLYTAAALIESYGGYRGWVEHRELQHG